MASEAAIVLGLCMMLAMGMLIVISRHKKSATGQLRLVGSIGMVDTKLEPHGTVLIQGELWRASSSEGTGLATGSLIEVIGTRDHLLVVKLRAQ